MNPSSLFPFFSSFPYSLPRLEQDTTPNQIYPKTLCMPSEFTQLGDDKVTGLPVVLLVVQEGRGAVPNATSPCFHRPM